ncbi:MAG: RNA-binding protein [Bacteroidota bacterium]
MLIRVSNIDRSTSVDDIWDLFAEFGDVEEAEINDMPDTNKDTFTGYVQMTYADEGKEAITELNGEWIDGQAISVKEVAERDPIEEESPALDDELAFEEEDAASSKTELGRRGTEIADD